MLASTANGGQGGDKGLLVFSRAQQWIIGVSVAVLVGAAVYVAVSRGQHPAAEPLFEEPATGAPNGMLFILVDVGGEVARPGLYRLPPNSRTSDALAAAGGVTALGDTSALNLAAFLRDGDKVFVPRRAPAPPAVAKRALVPTSPPSGGTQPATPAGFGPISINRASAAELERLPGVGPAIARRIVEYRTQHGYFFRLEDLMLVPGIGPKNFEKMRPYLSL